VPGTKTAPPSLNGPGSTQQGVRFTLSEPARRRILSLLLQLNHARHAEEQARETGAPPRAGPKRVRKQQMPLL
jgi:hypothetical protein